MNDKQFDFFSSRLTFINVSDNNLFNIELWHYLSVFETHIYGIFLQYNRIIADLAIPNPEEPRHAPTANAGLDIYYYILTWDKLKKIYEKLKMLINRLQQMNTSIPKTFNSDMKLWKKRIDHLFSEFDDAVRNEYEHPSLTAHSSGRIIMWGTIQQDSSGDIKAHAGGKHFAVIKKGHCLAASKLRVDLFDIFLKHFSQKPLTQELLKVREYIENNIKDIIKKMNDLKNSGAGDSFNDLLSEFTLYDINLSREGVPLSQELLSKVYSTIFTNEVDKQKNNE